MSAAEPLAPWTEAQIIAALNHVEAAIKASPGGSWGVDLPHNKALYETYRHLIHLLYWPSLREEEHQRTLAYLGQAPGGGAE